MDNQDKSRLKNRIEQVLSEILSDKYECKVKLRFEKTNTETCDTRKESAA